MKLSSRELFYSSLTSDTVFESDYASMCGSDSAFELGEYSDLYLKIDILLLADVFENFRNSCITSYGLRVLLYTTGFYVGCDVKSYTCKIRTSFRHRHGHVHRTAYTWKFEPIFKQIRTG